MERKKNYKSLIKRKKYLAISKLHTELMEFKTKIHRNSGEKFLKWPNKKIVQKFPLHLRT